jgi:hypothetical protein
MRQKIICKGLAVAVIILFIGVGVQPAIAKTKDRINHPPDAPKIKRDSHPRSYQLPIIMFPTIYWNITTTDPDGDDIYLQIDWGDGTFQNWFGPFHSDEKVPVNHTYSHGNFGMRARAKDTYGAIGPWGEEYIPIGENNPPDIEPKDYLFQTIIDIANNPEVKNLLEKYGNDLYKVDIDRSAYRKLFLRNPRLMFNMLFTKPSMSMEYLDKCYNNGVEFTNIIGEDKALDMMNSIEVTNPDLFDEFNIIIMNDGELSNRLETLKEMNKELNPASHDEIICAIAGTLFILFLILAYPFFPFVFIYEEITDISNPILKGILLLVYLPIFLPISIYLGLISYIGEIGAYLLIEYDCGFWEP